MQLIQITQVTLTTTTALNPKRLLALEQILVDEIFNLTTGLCSIEIKQVKLFKKINGEIKSTQGSILNLESNELILTTHKIMGLQKKLRKHSSLEKVKVLVRK